MAKSGAAKKAQAQQPSPLKGGGKNKKVQVDRATARREFLALRPGRNPKIAWEEVSGKVVLKVPRPNDWRVKLARKLFPVPDAPKVVELDALGSHVWKRCDGKNNIGVLAKALQSEYKLSAREAELSLQQFFKTLGQRGYVGFVTDKS